MILLVLPLVYAAGYVFDIQQYILVRKPSGRPQIFVHPNKIPYIHGGSFWKCGSLFCLIPSLDGGRASSAAESCSQAEPQVDSEIAAAGSHCEDVDLLQEYSDLKPLYDLYLFLNGRPFRLAYFTEFLMESLQVSLGSTIMKFRRMTVLFALWERALRLEDVFSHSFIEHHTSVDLRFRIQKGFFFEVFNSANVSSLLERLMRRKSVTGFRTFDVFVSILKFAIQKEGIVAVTQHSSLQVSSHAFRFFSDIYPRGSLVTVNPVFQNIKQKNPTTLRAIERIGRMKEGMASYDNFLQIFEALSATDFELSTPFSVNLSPAKSVSGFVTNGRLFFDPNILASFNVPLKSFFVEAASTQPLFRGIACSLDSPGRDGFMRSLRDFAVFLDSVKTVISGISVYSRGGKDSGEENLQLLYSFLRLPEGEGLLDFWALDVALTMAALLRKNEAEGHTSFVVEVWLWSFLELGIPPEILRQKLLTKYHVPENWSFPVVDDLASKKKFPREKMILPQDTRYLETFIGGKHKLFRVRSKGKVASSTVVYFDGIMIFGFEFGEGNTSFGLMNHIAFKQHELRFWGFALHFKNAGETKKIKSTLFTMLKIYLPSAVRVFIYRQVEATSILPPFGQFSPQFQMEVPSTVQLDSLTEDLSTYLTLLRSKGKDGGVMILFEL